MDYRPGTGSSSRGRASRAQTLLRAWPMMNFSTSWQSWREAKIDILGLQDHSLNFGRPIHFLPQISGFFKARKNLVLRDAAYRSRRSKNIVYRGYFGFSKPLP